MRITHDEFRRAGLARPLNGRKHLGRHPLPCASVLERGGSELVCGSDPRDALHICRDVDFERTLGRNSGGRERQRQARLEEPSHDFLS